MSGYLLDTNVISELRKRDRANPNVIDWVSQRRPDELWLSVMTVAEVRQGIELKRRRDPDAALVLDTWLLITVDTYGDRILPVTPVIAERWARLAVPDPLPVVDGLLAATAIEHDLTLVTRNVAHVERTGVRLVNPFTADG